MPKRTDAKPNAALKVVPPLRARTPSRPPLDDFDGPEHRRFPRAALEVPFSLWIGEEGDRRFSARLPSVNVSVSGAFLASSFFLPLGTEVRVGFSLASGEEPVQARAEIVREERQDAQGRGRSGFALRFLEFFSQSEVTLAKLFLGAQLRDFAQGYLASKRARSLSSELDRVVDALAAWELLKVTNPDAALGLYQSP